MLFPNSLPIVRNVVSAAFSIALLRGRPFLEDVVRVSVLRAVSRFAVREGAAWLSSSSRIRSAAVSSSIISKAEIRSMTFE